MPDERQAGLKSPGDPRETIGRLAVLRDGGALVLDATRRVRLVLDPERLQTSGAMHGDTVVARRLRRQTGTRPQAAHRPPAGAGSPGACLGDRKALSPWEREKAAAPRGEIVRVLERANPTVVGTYQRSGRQEWLTPDDRRLPAVTVRRGALGALSGEKVVVAISRYPSAGHPDPIGSVVERLGLAGEPDAETMAIIRGLGLGDSFPEDVQAEAESLPREVRAEDRRGRLDLTGRVVFTIDDADARDLDDAISLDFPPAPGPHSGLAGVGQLGPGPGPRSRGQTGFCRLGVHIADVAHYVSASSALDREARQRGTSVYLSDRVLPMFPTHLSNGIASLHPGVDRLTVSVFMDIDTGGRVVGYDIRRSVIRSVARLTYDAVAAGDGGAADVDAVLRTMADLAGRLRRRRMKRGSLDFDLAEEKARLDEEGRPVEIVRRPRNVATQLIEEFMIAANETVADHLLWRGLPFLARVHDQPSPEDLASLREILGPLGYKVPTTRTPRPADLQTILEAARGRPEGQEVHAALLRALAQARYSATRAPHFALASANYLHFTSPIRRYPDLTVHRQVVARPEDTAADAEGDSGPAGLGRLEAVAESCSRAERVAERAEAESLKLMKARLAQSCLGDIEEGAVVDVYDFGAFVRLPNGVEGLVPVSAWPRAGLKLGQTLRVQVVRVDVAKRHVDLAPV